ncbi:MAG TPA: winged helix-turn-helix domain-containing protein [Candidatus Acidoferrum sp.]|nr:winged helix-turn-helix domain-containing protein [Candidatus Acidoferrum sp.]
MGTYRSKLDIIADILHVVIPGAKKTQIMYRANLSHRLLTKYLMEVREACLVSFQRRERCYVLTSKGREFLETYKDYARRNKYAEKHLLDAKTRRKALERMCSFE